MYETIKNFQRQFLWNPEIIGKMKTEKFSKFIIVGMGGSGLGGDLLGVRVWRDYGLPKDIDKKNTLVIASSYSGNTEETLNAAKTALRKKLNVAVVATGGKLLTLAKTWGMPYIQLPSASWRTNIQPRMATGYSVRALLKFMGRARDLSETTKLAKLLDAKLAEIQGKDLAEKLRGFVPIIYSSARNSAIAYNWKIKFNETGKIPAFSNVLPELNHNEMTGFDIMPRTRKLSDKFHFVFLEDEKDDPRVQKRMKILKKLYGNRKLKAYSISLYGANRWHKIFQNLLAADFAAYYLAKHYGVDPEQVPMVEEFKKLMK